MHAFCKLLKLCMHAIHGKVMSYIQWVLEHKYINGMQVKLVYIASNY